MSLHVIQGLMGAGKTYATTNKILRDWVMKSERPIATNLPLNFEEFVHSCARSEPGKDSIRKRFKFLRDREVELPPLTEEDQKALDPEDLLARPKTANELKEFWWFTEPNSVVIMDECADIYNSADYKFRPRALQSFINHHRHYKDDIYFVCQSTEDLDVQIRRKIQFLWTVRNSKYENISKSPIMRGIRWPIQIFFVRVYSLEKGFQTTEMKIPPVDTYPVVPNSRGYKNYRSFSVSAKLPGKKPPPESAESGDIQKGRFQFLKTFWAQSSGLFVMLAFALTIGFFGYKFIWKLEHLGTDEHVVKAATGGARLGAQSGTVVQPVERKTTSEVIAVKATEFIGPPAVGHTNTVQQPTIPDEKIILRSRSELLTNRRRYHAGDKIGTNTISSFLLDGVLFTDGTGSRYDQLSF